MDHALSSRVIVFFVALAVAACAASVSAQEYCGDGSVAHAVQVTFAGCGDMPDNVSVHEGEGGELLPLMRNPTSGYWEADRKTFEPPHLKLCAPDCSRAYGCARPTQTLAIDRGTRRVCAGRYVIRCTQQVWRVHVDTGSGRRWFLYKILKRTPGATEKPKQGGKRAPFDLCKLAEGDQIEIVLQVQGIDSVVAIPLKPIHLGLFERAQTVQVNRDELARGFQTATGIKRALSVEERERLPNVVTFKLID